MFLEKVSQKHEASSRKVFREGLEKFPRGGNTLVSFQSISRYSPREGNIF